MLMKLTVKHLVIGKYKDPEEIESVMHLAVEFRTQNYEHV